MLASAPPPRFLADATALPLRSNSADVVFCTFTIGYQPGCFAELARITRPAGTLIITDIHPGAIAAGWSRSFRVGDDVIEPAHHPYAINTLAHPSLTRTLLLEPHIGEPERAIFARAGRLASFEAACSPPAIFVAIWSKQ
jgi:malonyl-CoA O-methyltransferase